MVKTKLIFNMGLTILTFIINNDTEQRVKVIETLCCEGDEDFVTDCIKSNLESDEYIENVFEADAGHVKMFVKKGEYKILNSYETENVE